MPSYTVLDTNQLKEWDEKIEKLENTPLDTPPREVINYYRYLMENNHAYGNLAYQAAQSSRFCRTVG